MFCIKLHIKLEFLCDAASKSLQACMTQVWARVSYLINWTIWFKYSLTDKPDTPWAPTVSHLAGFVMGGISPASVWFPCPIWSPGGTIFWHCLIFLLQNQHLVSGSSVDRVKWPHPHTKMIWTSHSTTAFAIFYLETVIFMQNSMPCSPHISLKNWKQVILSIR